jgi:hypothetical protein
MLSYNKKAKKRPVGGEQYPEYGMMFRADTFPELVDKLRSFRLNNNIPTGNPEHDILFYYATVFPWMVVDDMEAYREEKHSEEYLQWRQWVYDTWKTPPKQFVSSKEAEFRTAACMKCPHNKPMNWKKTDESQGLTARCYMLRRGMGGNIGQIGFCSYHKADISAFNFCSPAEKFSKNTNPEGYPDCWIGKTADLLTSLKRDALNKT